jgi:putative transposase
MAAIRRRITYKLTPSVTRVLPMEGMCDLHRALYNALGFLARCKSFARTRRDDPAYLGPTAQSVQVTLKRLDLAFGHFLPPGKGGRNAGLPEVQGAASFSWFRVQDRRRRVQIRGGRDGNTVHCGCPASASCSLAARRGGQVTCLRRCPAQGGWLVSVSRDRVRTAPRDDQRHDPVATAAGAAWRR